MPAAMPGRYKLLALLCLSVLVGALFVTLRATRLGNELGRTDTFQQIRRILVREHGLDVAAVTLDADLGTDLKLDSLDRAELAMEIEEAFSIPLTEEEAARYITVRDLVASVEHKLDTRRREELAKRR